MFSTSVTASGITLLSLSTFAINLSPCLCFTKVPRLDLSTSKLKLLQPFPISGDKILAVKHTLSVIPRGGAVGVLPETIQACYDWNSGLGAPAALIAGAVIATVYEIKNKASLDYTGKDKKYVQQMEKTTMILLITAFIFELVSIFVTTIMGTMLLSKSFDGIPLLESSSHLSFLKNNFEFEYLTSRICFLQGLLNWMTAIALSISTPREEEDKATRKMNKFLGSSILTMVFWMLSFYNNHLTFYPNYCTMLYQWVKVSWLRFFYRWPPRPMIFMIVPMISLSAVLGYQAFSESNDE